MSTTDAFRAYARRVRWDIVIAGYAAALGIGLLFAFAVAALGDWNAGLGWERAMLQSVRAASLPPLADSVMVLAPWLGTNWTTLPIAVLLVIWLGGFKQRWDLALPIAVIQFGSNTLNAALKHVAWRERPELWEKRGQFAWPSYPSGHAIATLSVLLFLTILLARERGSKWGVLTVVPLVMLVLYSRLYLGVHWPTDVVGGALVGATWLATILYAFPLPHNESGQRAASGALATDAAPTTGV